MSWVHRDDAVGVIACALSDERYVGAINVVAPAPVQNAAFTAAFSAALHRPAVLPAPRWALRLALGQMADEVLLASSRALPMRLQALGYRFQEPTLGAALIR
jgi:NAD dependent epimerase/dehydratase family enzyme